MAILDSKGPNGFLTKENIETLQSAGIAPKITSSDKMEIYRFEKNKDQKSEN